MNSGAMIFVALLLVAVVLVLFALWQDRGQWVDTGEERTEVVPFKNGWRKEQKFYQQVDLNREGRFRWQESCNYTRISPAGERTVIDTTDYGM